MGEEQKESDLPDYMITGEKLLNRQVCSRLSADDLVPAMRTAGDLVSGTTAGWVLTDRPDAAPVKCKKYSERTHYMFDC